MARGPMSEEAKKALMERLKAGKAKHSEMRKADPTHKPRKPRKKKATTDKAEALSDPLANKPANESIPGIDAPVPSSRDVVSAKPVDPAPNVTSKIDVPNLPDEKDRKKIVKKPLKEPVEPPVKGIAPTGLPKKYDDNVMLRNEETGNQAIETMLPGQKESIKKLLRKNKKENTPLAPKPQGDVENTTVKSVKKHIPDMKAVEARKPFSFSVVRQLLYQ
jgi:hypothetical protein